MSDQNKITPNGANLIYVPEMMGSEMVLKMQAVDKDGNVLMFKSLNADMQTKTYIYCPTCDGTRKSIIPGQPCGTCNGSGMVEYKPQGILEAVADVKIESNPDNDTFLATVKLGRPISVGGGSGKKQACKTCKHWEREIVPDFPNTDIKTPLGRCSIAAMINYFDNVDSALSYIEQGQMGGENIYTHENFGCIHYEQKQ